MTQERLAGWEGREALIERVARAMQAVSRPDVDPDKLTPGPRGSVALRPVWSLYSHMAEAAIGPVIEECARLCDEIAGLADDSKNIGMQAGSMLSSHRIRQLTERPGDNGGPEIEDGLSAPPPPPAVVEEGK